MTSFTKDQIGDKGQRFKVTAVLNGIRQDIGYCSSYDGALKLLRGVKLWPSASHEDIVDRHKL